MNRGSFDGEVAGSDGHPFSAALFRSNNAGSISHKTPLWQLAKEPVDCFRLVNDLRVVIIRTMRAKKGQKTPSWSTSSTIRFESTSKMCWDPSLRTAI